MHSCDLSASPSGSREQSSTAGQRKLNRSSTGSHLDCIHDSRHQQSHAGEWRHAELLGWAKAAATVRFVKFLVPYRGQIRS